MTLFYHKTNPSFKWKYAKDTSNNYFHINNHNLTHFLLLSIFELRKNKTRCFQKMHSEFFCNIARINDMKGWKSLVSLRTMFHAPTRLPINIANEHTLCTSFFQLNDHQIQILKKEKCKRSPHFWFLRCKVIILRGVWSNSLLFFSRIWKDVQLLFESSLSYSI